MSDTSPTQAPFERSYAHRIFGGICSGLAIRNGMSPGVGQLLGLLLFILTGGLAIVAYIVLWFLLPMEPVDEETAARIDRQRSHKRAIVLFGVFLVLAFIYIVLRSLSF